MDFVSKRAPPTLPSYTAGRSVAPTVVAVVSRGITGRCYCGDYWIGEAICRHLSRDVHLLLVWPSKGVRRSLTLGMRDYILRINSLRERDVRPGPHGPHIHAVIQNSFQVLLNTFIT